MKNFFKPTKETWIVIILMILILLTTPVPFIGIPGKIIFILTVLFMPGLLHLVLGKILDEKSVAFISISVISDAIIIYVTASIIAWVWHKIKNRGIAENSTAGEE